MMRRAPWRILGALVATALSGCITVKVPPDIVPLLLLQSLQDRDAPAVRTVEVDGRTWTVAKLGLILLDLETRMAFIGLVGFARHEGNWPQFETITVGGTTWNSARLGDHLLLEAKDSDAGVRRLLLTRDGYISIDERLVPTFEKLQSVVDRYTVGLPASVIPTLAK